MDHGDVADLFLRAPLESSSAAVAPFSIFGTVAGLTRTPHASSRLSATFATLSPSLRRRIAREISTSPNGG